MTHPLVKSFAGAAIASMTTSAVLAADVPTMVKNYGLEGAQDFYARGSGFLVKQKCDKPDGDKVTCNIVGIDGMYNRAMPITVTYTSDKDGKVIAIDAQSAGDARFISHHEDEAKAVSSAHDVFRARHQSHPVTEGDYKITKEGGLEIEQALRTNNVFAYSGPYRSIDGFSFTDYHTEDGVRGIRQSSCALVPAKGAESETGHDADIKKSEGAICVTHFLDKANVKTTVTFHAVGAEGLVSSDVVSSKPFGRGTNGSHTEFDIRRLIKLQRFLGTDKSTPLFNPE